jgi:hypothetical protein
MSGGTAVPLKQEPTQDINDERITDVSVPVVDLRKSRSWVVSYDVPAGVVGTELLTSLTQQYALGSKIFTLDQTYQRCMEYTQLVWTLGQSYKMRCIEKTLTQEYVLESGSGSTMQQSFLGMKQSLMGWDYYEDFVDRINQFRVAGGGAPCKLYKNKNSVPGGMVAWYPAHWSGTYDVQLPYSTLFPTGYKYLNDYRDDPPEWMVFWNVLYIQFAQYWLPTSGADLADEFLSYPELETALLTTYRLDPLKDPEEKQYIWLGVDDYWQSPTLDADLSNPPGTYYAYVVVFIGLLQDLGGDGMVESALDQRYEQNVYDTIELSQAWQQDAYYKVRQQAQADYGIALARQHEAQAGCMVAYQHEAPIHYGLLTSHEASYQAMVLLTTQHENPYIIDQYAWARQQHEAGFSAGLIVAGHVAEYTGLDRVLSQTESIYEMEQYLRARQQHDAGYSGSFLSAQHEAWYYPLGRVASQHQSSYTAVSAVAAQQEAVYDLTVLNRLMLGHGSIFSLLPSLLVSVPPGGPAPAQRVVYYGRDMEVTQAVVEVAEGDVAWTFDASLANVSDYQIIQRGEPITVVIEGDSYSMFVTSKELRRSGPANTDMMIRGSSPILLKAPPFSPLYTKEYTLALSAEAIVEDALGTTVDWQTLDWIIPAYRVAITEGSPIDLATQVVGAVGAVLESLEDGSLRVRPLFPISVPDFDTTTPDFVFTDVEHGLSYYEGYEPVTGYNRFRIRDADSTYSDSLEYIEDAVDPLSGGVIRAYPSPWRATTVLEHTWDSRVSITPLGLETRTVDKELVEFVAGEGSTQQPILAILDVEWESLPITGLTFEPHTRQIKTSNLTDFGLAKITYTVQSYNYRVSQPVGTDVQYILRDV